MSIADRGGASTGSLYTLCTNFDVDISCEGASRGVPFVVAHERSRARSDVAAYSVRINSFASTDLTRLAAA